MLWRRFSVVNLFQRLQQGKLPLGRIEAFSDGIFAVAATLLVLDLKDISVPPIRPRINCGKPWSGNFPNF
jgi:hypothetical protein